MSQNSRRFGRVSQQNLGEIHKALTLVQGSFVAAAKLLDMTPQRLRNLVNYHAPLKAKWGKRRGYAGLLGFHIVPFCEPWPESTCNAAVAKELIRHLSPAEQGEIRAWLTGECPPVESVENVENGNAKPA